MMTYIMQWVKNINAGKKINLFTLERKFVIINTVGSPTGVLRNGLKNIYLQGQKILV